MAGRPAGLVRAGGPGRPGRSDRGSSGPRTGVDLVERFLDEGRRQAIDRRVDVEFRHGDMREGVAEGETHDAAICFWGSFGYFDDAGNLAQARATCAALR